jgi:hypothetical protein
MASCGCAAQRGLWPPVAVQPSAGYGLLWLCSPVLAIASSGCAAQRWLWRRLAVQPSAGYGLLVSRGSLITQNDAPQSVGPLWTSDSSSQRPLLDNTQQTNVHAFGGIRTHDHSRRAAVDLRLRKHGHWDRHIYTKALLLSLYLYEYFDQMQWFRPLFNCTGGPCTYIGMCVHMHVRLS